MFKDGFIDTHIHGAFGEDTSDGSVEGILKMAKLLPSLGVSAFCPTTMTTSFEVVNTAFEAVCKAKDILSTSNEPYAEILGIHLEGPFLSPVYAGVQNKDFCVTPSKGFDFINQLENNYPGILKIIDIAPELDGAMEFITEYKDKYVLSLAHTNADYDLACKSFEAGVQSVTHVMNAMAPCDKRNPGILGALVDNPNVYCEVICDGIHIAPSFLRIIFKLLSEDRLIVVSDSMRGAGMPDGLYKLADADVLVKNGRTYYGEHGGLAGSVTYMAQEVERLKEFGISEDIIRKATFDNPLRRLHIK